MRIIPLVILPLSMVLAGCSQESEVSKQAAPKPVQQSVVPAPVQQINAPAPVAEPTTTENKEIADKAKELYQSTKERAAI